MRVVRWLMVRLGVPSPVIGDVEEDAGRHSRLWPWKQALFAIFRAFLDDGAKHPLIVTRGVIVGCLLLALAQTLMRWIWSAINLRWITLVAQLGLRHQIAPLSGLLGALIASPLAFAIGWLVTGLNRTATAAAAMLFVALNLLLDVPTFSRLILNAIDAPRFVPSLIVNSIGLIVFTISVLTGATWSLERYAAD